MTDRLINANDVIEHAEVNGESPEFVRKLIDYLSDHAVRNDGDGTIPEREREALMRLTMCARGECPMCIYEERCNDDFQMNLSTENTNILADALIRKSYSEEVNNELQGL